MCCVSSKGRVTGWKHNIKRPKQKEFLDQTQARAGCPKKKASRWYGRLHGPNSQSLVLNCFQHWKQFFHLLYFLDKIAPSFLLCRALRICVAHAPTESCPFFLRVHWACRACYRSCLPLLHHASLPQNWSVQTSIQGQPLGAPRWCFCDAR